MDEIVLTVDVDWAPDVAIAWLSDRLIEHGARSTWFVTHPSEAIERLRSYPELFELGIHPNFLPGSTQGDSPDEVIDYCMRLVPGAASVRTHGLVQSTALLGRIMQEESITADVSVFLPSTPHLRPVRYHWSGRAFWRIPYFWADDYAMQIPRPSWELAPLLGRGPGLKVFCFHPIHVYLNSADMEACGSFKRRGGRLENAAADRLEPYVNTGVGTRNLFEQLLARAADGGQHCGQYRRIRDLCNDAESGGVESGGNG